MRNLIIAAAAVIILGSIIYAVTSSDVFQDVTGGQENVPLVSTSWKLVELNGDDVKLLEGMTRPPEFALETGTNRMTGFGGCNKISGTYLVVGKKLSFPDNIIMTRMACPAGMDIEQGFTQALKASSVWHIKGQTLQLRDKNGTTTAVFEPVSAQ